MSHEEPAEAMKVFTKIALICRNKNHWDEGLTGAGKRGPKLNYITWKNLMIVSLQLLVRFFGMLIVFRMRMINFSC